MSTVTNAPTPPEAIATPGARVLQVEDIVRTLLLLLDFDTIDALLAGIQTDRSLSVYMRDAPLWGELVVKHFGAAFPTYLRYLALPQRERSWDWTSYEHTCQELRDFLRAGDECLWFGQAVQIVLGNLRTITEVNGAPIDGIAFPTNSHLTNHYTGAALAIFERAGRELTDYVNDPLFRGRRPIGSAIVTPAFDSGVQKLIHCVGPSISMEQCYTLLETTYKNAMSAAMNEGLQCLAMTSISTGNLGVPVRGGAQVGLRAIQKFIRANNWRGTVAIVCIDMHVYDAFSKAKSAIVDGFNVAPPYPPSRLRAFGRHM